MAASLLWWLLACTGDAPVADSDPTGTVDTDGCDCPTVDTDPPGQTGWPQPTIEILAPGSVALGPSIVVDVRVYDFVFIGPALGGSGDTDGGDTDGVDTDTRTGAWRPVLPAYPLVGEGLAALEGSARAHDPTERPAGYIVLRLDGVIVAEEPATRFYLDGVAPGEHSIEAELRWLGGDEFFPPKIDIQTFSVE